MPEDKGPVVGEITDAMRAQAHAAKNAEDKPDLAAILPFKEYMDRQLTGLLAEGLKIVERERPQNPAEWLGVYLLKNSQDFNKAAPQAAK